MPERIHKRHFPPAMIMVPGILGITVAQVFERKNRSIPDLHAIVKHRPSILGITAAQVFERKSRSIPDLHTAVKHRPGILAISTAQILERRSRGPLHLAAAVIDIPPVDNISSLAATVLRVSGPHLRALLRPDTGPMFRAMRRTIHRRVSRPAPRPAAARSFRLLRRASIRPVLRRPLYGKRFRSQCRCKRHRSKHHRNRWFHIRFSFFEVEPFPTHHAEKSETHPLYIKRRPAPIQYAETTKTQPAAFRKKDTRTETGRTGVLLMSRKNYSSFLPASAASMALFRAARPAMSPRVVFSTEALIFFTVDFVASAAARFSAFSAAISARRASS